MHISRTCASILGISALIIACQALHSDNLPDRTVPDVMAIYFGDWHPDPDMQQLHGKNWTEWEVVVNAQPRWEGHLQPNIPLESPPAFGRHVQENTPETMQGKVNAALKSGINAFLFDWYWYAEKGAGGGGGFLNGALDQGFLPLTNTEMKFALMWANQDWVDIHPAKKGWHATGRPKPNPLPVVQPGEKPRGVRVNDINMLLQYDGFMNRSTYLKGFQYVVENYFVRPNYYKAPTKLQNGSIAECAYFAIYQFSYLIDGVGGIGNAADLMDDFRSMAEKKGQCVHLVAMIAGNPVSIDKKMDTFRQLKIASSTSYCFMKIVPQQPGISITEYMNYSWMVKSAVNAWGVMSSTFQKSLSIPFAPTLSVAWDSTPRTLPQDPFGNWGYPWGHSFVSTPASFESALRLSKEYLNQYCRKREEAENIAGQWCPPLILNAWNEWSEGAYLEPDQRYGTGKLDAVAKVFGRDNESY